ncbi:NUMOD4 domain-containing protein [Flavihumibacter rivuli]|uniref:NUMOD4 domain-containing protein n=1 Tax=Flavihumibacter rivuli TaxID=2838156 RepID=UPI001BDEF7C3|nr:NUMOD4 domain-containing protein [Flavihumibacter rivuli]ULQ55293.1 NUMOD4 domain-containing protein [Flavihumibacter rivuli]
MIKSLPGEVWKPLQFPGWKHLRKQYALSSGGRIASYTENVNEDGKLLNGSLTTGYKTLNLHRPGNNGTLYIHREIARLFLKKPSPKHRYVIHVNHNKTDNSVKNLKWATLDEMIEHQQASPAKIAYKKVQANRSVGLKLSASQVKSIKKVLNSKSRNLTIKQLAEKYGVSEMTMYRIKSGENWAKVK